MTTKFDLNQQVWCVAEDILIKGTIDFITASDKYGIAYCIPEYDEEFSEDFVFDNPSDATLAWMELNNLTLDTFVVATIKPLESN